MKEFGSAVILAGGLSTRMGFDKQFLEIGDTVLSRYLAATLFLEFDEVIIVTNRPECYSGDAVRAVSDIIPGRGPLSGIHAGLSAASSRYVYCVACDMPTLSLDYIRHLKNTIHGGFFDACVARAGEWIEPFQAFYSQSIIPRIQDYLDSDRRSVFPLLQTLNTLYLTEEEVRPFNRDGRLFANLNTPRELEEFIASLSGGMLPFVQAANREGHAGVAAFA
ncbi:MAG: molybdenum cofactor guanylyltransferase [Geobacteraceae bacterium]|nr:molybdenum cofactor guanylyltransferase [Geobacteraceae bacterium]